MGYRELRFLGDWVIGYSGEVGMKGSGDQWILKLRYWDVSRLRDLGIVDDLCKISHQA